MNKVFGIGEKLADARAERNRNCSRQPLGGAMRVFCGVQRHASQSEAATTRRTIAEQAQTLVRARLLI
jgi:hypothetical protein